jgi:hypothetical protein
MEKREFIQFVEEVNKHFTFVVVDNTGHSNEPEEFLKLIRASPEKSVPKTINAEPDDAEE